MVYFFLEIYHSNKKLKKKEENFIMWEIINLREELLLDDKQIDMLAFAIKPQDIKNYINEHKKEYQRWLIQETTKQIYEKYGNLIFQKMRERMSVLLKDIKIQNTLLALKVQC